MGNYRHGLAKPCYLFGTIHLRDKRVFEFSDSALLKLEACDEKKKNDN